MICVMKSVGEILLGYKDDPEKERKRARILKEARDWEESVIEGEARALPVARPPRH